MIEFSGEYELEYDRDELWDYFTDPDVLAECAPGTKELNLVGPAQLEGVLAVGVGSVKPTFDVEMTVVKADRPEVLEMKTEGNASRNAFESIATMELIENDSNGTTATWSAQADVSGTIASLGQRALGSVTKRLVQNFFEDLEERVNDAVDATSQLEENPSVDADLQTDSDSEDDGASGHLRDRLP